MSVLGWNLFKEKLYSRVKQIYTNTNKNQPKQINTEAQEWMGNIYI